MEGTMLAALCFTFIIVAMALPGLILIVIREAASEAERQERHLAHGRRV
jgi:hypothetical protein